MSLAHILNDAFETIPAVSILANFGQLLTQGKVAPGIAWRYLRKSGFFCMVSRRQSQAKSSAHGELDYHAMT
jgi:hypothetical protein